MNLPIVDTFTPAFEDWETRDPTLEEAVQAGSFHHRIPVKLRATVSNAVEAAFFAAQGKDNALRNFIDRRLDESLAFTAWRKAMPPSTPTELSRYRNSFPVYDLEKVSAQINALKQRLSEGQYLFHGGLWPGVDSLVTTRPLSTSLCPQVALSNAYHNAKAFDAGRIDLWVLRVTAPRSHAFVFRRKGANLGHENEVLFAEGAHLSLVSEHIACTDHCVGKYGYADKRIPVYIMSINIS